VYEGRMLRRIFGPKGKEVAESWRNLYSELHNLTTSPNINNVIKLRRMK
jgi:hypothetical protein